MNLNKKNGFTIVELAIVITIIAFLISMIVSTGAARIEAQRINITKERLAFLMNAITQYVRAYNHLPCPADGSLAFDEPAFGIGSGSNTDNGDCTAENANHGGTNVVIGMIPLETLGLSATIGVDGWDNRFTYVVDQDLTYVGEEVETEDPPERGFSNNGNPATLPAHSDPGTLGEIAIRNSAGGADFTSEAAVLILSHGPNGYGAWKGKGGSQINPTGGSAEEDENTDNDNIFVQTFRGGTFDDFILYKVKGQLLQDQ